MLLLQQGRKSSHLADLVEGILAIAARVFEVVVCWEGAVDVPGDGAVLWGFLNRWLADMRVVRATAEVGGFRPAFECSYIRLASTERQ